MLNGKKLPKVLGWLVTMIIVTCNWCIFKADTISDAFNYILNMFSLRGGFIDDASLYYWKQSIVTIIISIICCVPWMEVIKNRNEEFNVGILTRSVALVGIFVISALMIINGNYSPFIYFNF